MLENPLILIPMITGLVFCLSGMILLKFPPTINSLYGYRTNNSMKNAERWSFAQNYASKQMVKLGIVLAVVGLLGLPINFSTLTNLAIGLGLMILTIIVFLLSVENAIKKRFDKL